VGVPDPERDAVITVAELMLVAARTAPKAKGETAIMLGDDLTELADKMRRLAGVHGRAFYVRDAGNVESSDCVVIIGSRAHEPLGMDCGMCGYRSCAERLKAPMRGPFCEFEVIDLGWWAPLRSWPSR